MSNPAADLATALVSASPVGGVTLVLAPSSSCNVFIGPVQPTGSAGGLVPARAIFFLTYGGPGPEPYMDGTAKDWRESRVQVIVRSEQSDHSGGEGLARAVHHTLHRATISGYTFILALDEATYLKKDEQGCHLWALNFRCGRKDNDTGELPASLSGAGDRTVTGNLTVEGSASLNTVSGSTSARSLTLSTASGSDAVAFSTSGARLRLGPGVNEYFSGSSGSISCATDFNGAGYVLSVTANGGFRSSGATAALLQGFPSDGASTVGVRIRAGTPLSTSGAAIATFENSTTPKLVVDKDGNLRLGSTTGPRIVSGSGSPEGVVTAPVGSLYLRTDGGAGSTLWVKESGSGNTGWAFK